MRLWASSQTRRSSPTIHQSSMATICGGLPWIRMLVAIQGAHKNELWWSAWGKWSVFQIIQTTVYLWPRMSSHTLQLREKYAKYLPLIHVDDLNVLLMRQLLTLMAFDQFDFDSEEINLVHAQWLQNRARCDSEYAFVALTKID